MELKTITEILNTVTVKKYVNLCFDGDLPADAGKAAEIAEKAAQIAGIICGITGDKTYYIDVNIADLLEDISAAGSRMTEIFNEQLAKHRFRYWFDKALAIDDALMQLNYWLDRPALVVFHFFKNTTNRQERDILIAIRKFIMQRESVFLRLLILSNNPVNAWDLSPYSDLDEPYIGIGKYNLKHQSINWSDDKDPKKTK